MLILCNVFQKMRDTFVHTLQWSIPGFTAKMTELGEHRCMVSNIIDVEGKMFQVYLYPKGFTFYHNAVGIFLDILPDSSPVLIKFMR